MPPSTPPPDKQRPAHARTVARHCLGVYSMTRAKPFGKPPPSASPATNCRRIIHSKVGARAFAIVRTPKVITHKLIIGRRPQISANHPNKARPPPKPSKLAENRGPKADVGTLYAFANAGTMYPSVWPSMPSASNTIKQKNVN